MMDLPPMTLLAGKPPTRLDVLEQMTAESSATGPALGPADVHHDEHTPRYAVRFHPPGWAGHPYPSARLSCRDCEWEQGWYRHESRRDWSDAWPFLANWAADVIASHEMASHSVFTAPAWWGRRFA